MTDSSFYQFMGEYGIKNIFSDYQMNPKLLQEHSITMDPSNSSRH